MGLSRFSAEEGGYREGEEQEESRWGRRYGLDGAVAKLAQKKLQTGEAVEALHLSEIALTAAPNDDAALRAKLAAYEKLLEESNDENHYEVFWLGDLIKETRGELGISERSPRGAH